MVVPFNSKYLMSYISFSGAVLDILFFNYIFFVSIFPFPYFNILLRLIEAMLMPTEKICSDEFLITFKPKGYGKS